MSIDRTTNGPQTDHQTDARASEWSVGGHPPVGGDPRTTTRTTDLPAPPRRSNFESACLSIMSGLKSIEAEIDRLDAMKAKMRADLLEALKASDDRAIAFEGIGEAAVVSGRTTAVIVKPELIPERFYKREPDKTAIAKALRAGGDVAGAIIEEGAPTLRVVWAK